MVTDDKRMYEVVILRFNFFDLHSHYTKLTCVPFLAASCQVTNGPQKDIETGGLSTSQTLEFSSYNYQEKGHMNHCDRGDFPSNHRHSLLLVSLELHQLYWSHEAIRSSNDPIKIANELKLNLNHCNLPRSVLS
jgi:hypothetical protein